MKAIGYSLVFIALFLHTSCAVESETGKKLSIDVTAYVNPFIGTDFHGHTYPGATVPFGMVQLSPDSRTKGWDACSGYHYSDSVILGFSHTHLSGTGIGDMGDVLMMPFNGQAALNSGEAQPRGIGYKSYFRKENEQARPGYYSVFLDDPKVKAELSATTRAGIHKYTFPKSENAGIIIDLAHSIHQHKVTEADIHIISDTELSGYRKTKGWAIHQYVYFRAKFSKPFKVELYKDDKLVEKTANVDGTNLKAILTFDTSENEEVFVKVGISPVDKEGAEKNLNAEIPDFNFDKIVDDASQAWEKELGKIKVKGGTEDEKTVFYTSLYHSNLSPIIYSDVDGRYRGMDQKIHTTKHKNYTIFSLWDTYRAQHPLFTIIKPEYNQDLIRDLLRKSQEGGILPKWELAANYTGTMIGSHAVSVITDAYMKGYRDFDVELALTAMIEAVEYDSVRHIEYPTPAFIPALMPKAKLYDKKYGYIPNDLEGSSTSKGLEFAYNYWCIAVVAKDMGKESIAQHYFERSQHYKEYFDKETGFMRGKNLDGSWKEPFNPRFSAHWKTPYVEGNAWQWTWYVPHDVEGLMNLFGSKEDFAVKLDSLFTITSEVLGEEKSADITGLIGQYAHGNEPSHHIAYLYNYADQPWRTQEVVNQIRSEFYTNTPDGLCGNEDCGQMSAWYLLNAMGFYPVCPGSNQYSIGSPVFDRIEIEVEGGKTFKVSAKNKTAENKYVQKVYLNGKPLTNHYILHSDIVNGGEMIFEMGKEKRVFWN
ncbi:GH92 family glycosyl hydrolase [Saccharicrinis sp. 156]|uniref:GH92 family glycosyl hydrolase n=1 Tax=Saccharicrinis sp. 156 TaxID=3417574 RepID=UPI003D338D0D